MNTKHNEYLNMYTNALFSCFFFHIPIVRVQCKYKIDYRVDNVTTTTTINVLRFFFLLNFDVVLFHLGRVLNELRIKETKIIMIKDSGRSVINGNQILKKNTQTKEK